MRSRRFGFAAFGKMLENVPCPGDVSLIEQAFRPLEQDRGVGRHDWVERGTWARRQVEKGRGPVRARGGLIGLLLGLDARHTRLRRACGASPDSSV
jgi:hypothetical protein